MSRAAKSAGRGARLGLPRGERSKADNAVVAVRKTAWEALSESQEVYRHIIETTHEGIWMADLDGVTRFVNPPMARMLGTTREEMVGRPVFDFVFPEDHPTVRRHFAEFLNAPDGREVEERLRRLDGTEFWALVQASIFRAAQGQPVGFLGMFADMTERRRMEQALRLSEARLQLQIRRMPLAHVVWDTQFRALSWNPAAEKMFGYPQAEALGKHPYELIVPPEVRPQVESVWERLLQGDTTAHSVNANVTKAGQTLFCEWSNTPLREKNGTVVGVLSMVQDITQRKRAEEALKVSLATLDSRVRERTLELQSANQALAESEEKYRQLFATISDAVLVFDAETWQFVEVNEAAVRLYGYSRAEFLRLSHRQVTTEPEESEAAVRLAVNGTTPRIPLRYHRKQDGAVFPVEISASSFVLKGRPTICAIIRDITQRKRAEAAITRNRELEREILGISEREQQRLGQELHDDLCQQLAGIQFLSQRLADRLAARKTAASAQAAEIARTVQQTMRRTRELAHGLSPVRLESEGLADALRALVTRTREVYRLDCRLQCEVPVPVPDHAMAFHLYRIAQEAVANAVKHAKPGRIEVTLAAAHGAVELTVRDDGRGLPRTRRNVKGIGLRIMRYRAEVIGASLTIQREPKGGTAVVCSVQPSSMLPELQPKL